MKSVIDRFILVHSVGSDISHTINQFYQEAFCIDGFGPPKEEHTKIGVGCQIYLRNGQLLMVTETTEEIRDMMSKVNEVMPD